jgi:hypothetical protein
MLFVLYFQKFFRNEPLFVSFNHLSATTPRQAPYYTASTAFEKFFTLALAKQDTSDVVKNETSRVEKLGGNGTVMLQLFSSLESLLTNLSSTPTAAQNGITNQSVSEVLEFEKAFIEGLPGLKSVDTLFLNDGNREFQQTYRQLQNEGKAVINKTSTAYAYFSNLTLAKKMDELIYLSFNASFESDYCE